MPARVHALMTGVFFSALVAERAVREVSASDGPAVVPIRVDGLCEVALAVLTHVRCWFSGGFKVFDDAEFEAEDR